MFDSLYYKTKQLYDPDSGLSEIVGYHKSKERA